MLMRTLQLGRLFFQHCAMGHSDLSSCRKAQARQAAAKGRPAGAIAAKDRSCLPLQALSAVTALSALVNELKFKVFAKIC